MLESTTNVFPVELEIKSLLDVLLFLIFKFDIFNSLLLVIRLIAAAVTILPPLASLLSARVVSPELVIALLAVRV